MILSCLFSNSCSFKSSNPIITSIAPNSVFFGTPFEIIVNGYHFTEECKIVLSDQEIITTFISENKLTGMVSDETIATIYENKKAKNDIFVYILDASSLDVSKSIKLELIFPLVFEEPVFIFEDYSKYPLSLRTLIINEIPDMYALWINRNEGTYPEAKMLSYSDDSGKTWNAPVQIPDMDLSYVFLQSGKLIGFISDDECITLVESEDHGITWHSTEMVLRKEGIGLTRPVGGIDNNGHIYMIYGIIKQNNNEYGITFTVMRSSDNALIWELQNKQNFSIRHYTDRIKETDIVWFDMSKNGNFAIRYSYNAYNRFYETNSILSRDYGTTFEPWGPYPSGGGYTILTNKSVLYSIKSNSPHSMSFFKGYNFGREDVIETRLTPNYLYFGATMIIDKKERLFIARNEGIICSIDDGLDWTYPFEYGGKQDGNDRLSPKMYVDKDNIVYVAWSNDNGVYITKSKPDTK